MTGRNKKLSLRTAGVYAVKWLLPLALTVLLVTYMFRKVDFREMWHIMSHGVDYWWILAAMGLSVLSHVLRAARWRLQLRALGIRPPFMALCCSIFGTYALNLIFPRLGEVWRCTYIADREHKPFTTVVGSMVADRFADMILVVALMLLCFLVAAPAIEAFLVKYPVGQGLVEAAHNPWLWTLLVGGAYFAASLSRLILPAVTSPDEVMPMLVRMLLPNAGLQLFVLAIVSASLSTATAIFHIAVSALAEDLPGRKASRGAWLAGIIFCVLLSGGCAQIKGQLIALLCTTSWSIVGATVLVPYVALVRFGKRCPVAAWMSCVAGFSVCMFWYLMAHKSLGVLPLFWETASIIPPFFAGFAFSLAGWFTGWFLVRDRHSTHPFRRELF